jgi:putative flavoprotein involved in K+ transport
MPYLPFPDDWPVFTPKDKMGDWLEAYVKVLLYEKNVRMKQCQHWGPCHHCPNSPGQIMELNYWTHSKVLRASMDDAGIWTVAVDKGGTTIQLKTKHLVLATGMSGLPNVPSLPDMGLFRGDVHHSSQHKGGAPYAGKHCVVLGANTSAHDIAADLWEHGAALVTMVQRSPTTVVRAPTLLDVGLGDLYSERAMRVGVTTNDADVRFASIPYKLLSDFQEPLYKVIADRDAPFYSALAATGFLLDWGDDGRRDGLFMKYLRRASGYYIDVGASQLIIDGKVCHLISSLNFLALSCHLLLRNPRLCFQPRPF